MFASSTFKAHPSQRFIAPGVYRPLAMDLHLWPNRRLCLTPRPMFTRSLE